MELEVYRFILNNKKFFWTNGADGTGGDTSTDATASSVNPNALLTPVVGSDGLVKFLVIVALVLIIIYFFEREFFTKIIAAVELPA